MKRCPECNSLFPDAEHFCELDGAVLVATDSTRVVSQPKSSQALLPIGVLIGIVVGVLLVVVYFAMSRQTAPENSNTTSSTSSARQQEVIQPLQPTPHATASPSVEPSASASPSTEAPSPQSSSTPVELSSSDPISAAPGAKGIPVLIKLDSGVTIEADEAWQTGEGIWYRKHGVVALLDPKNVKAIEKAPSAVPQQSASTSPKP